MTQTAERERGEALLTVVAHLVAAVSLIKRAHNATLPPKMVVGSDKMFEQMLRDYDRAIQIGRAALMRVD